MEIPGKVIQTENTIVDHGHINKDIELGSELANGIYFVRITGPDINHVIRFTLDR